MDSSHSAQTLGSIAKNRVTHAADTLLTRLRDSLDQRGTVDALRHCIELCLRGKVSPALKAIGQPTKVGGGSFTDDDYPVTARWGIAGKGGITMPAKGRVVSRPLNAAEQSALGELSCGRSPDRATPPDRRSPAALSILGEETCDIFLNDQAYWKNVPRPVWQYTLGGYQVLKKWLSYREQTLLGRPLTVDEVTYFRDVIRRITALLLLGPSLDSNYIATKANTFKWQECRG